MSFGNEEEPLDQLMAEAKARTVASDSSQDGLRAAVSRSFRDDTLVTISLAIVIGFIAGALWRA